MEPIQDFASLISRLRSLKERKRGGCFVSMTLIPNTL